MRLMVALGLAALGLLAAMEPALAVPSFASQTGQPCTACHIGAFGPQLTAFGRAFKIGGYTLSGGDGLASKIPLAAFVQTSFNHTQVGQPGGAAPDFGDNNNPALDQVSLFLAGRFNDYAGAMIQTTYDGIGKSFFVDNSDIRLTTPVDIGDTNLRIGLSFNNGPTVQDPFNSSMVWGPPYEGSALAPAPSWEPILMGALQGYVLGVTAYAWYDNALYAEFGTYRTMDDKLAKTFGSFGAAPGNSTVPIPYGRVAYEWNWSGQSAHVGLIGLHAEIQPGEMAAVGTDKYNDLALDGSYQWIGDGTNIVTFLGSLTHESQHLDGSFSQGLSSNLNDTIDEFRANVTYFYKNTYGGSVGFKRIWGSEDSLLYAPAPISGSRTGKPDSTALMLEADWVPFGKDDSWGAPFTNVKLGVQYTYYPEFNGASTNYDGSGRNASGNNTLYAFAWFAF
jgi:hypothetical protein